jgi:hypothetical protein
MNDDTALGMGGMKTSTQKEGFYAMKGKRQSSSWDASSDFDDSEEENDGPFMRDDSIAVDKTD